MTCAMRWLVVGAMCVALSPIAAGCSDDGGGGGDGGDVEGGDGDADGEADADTDAETGDGPECTTATECDDGNACTADRCVGGRCSSSVVPDGTPCGGDPCFSSEACAAGVCVPGTPDLDADDDGYLTSLCGGDDCDDTEASVHPGATESGAAACADGLDNDCDGQADALDSACSGQVCVGDGWCFENPLPHGLAHGAVWPVSATEIWAGGNGVVHWVDGEATWQSLPGTFPSTNLTGLWASGPSDVWAVGGGIWHFDGTRWTQDTTLPFSMPSDVAGTGPNDVWVVCSGSINHWNGSGWRPVLSGVAETFRAIWALSPTDAWAGSWNGSLMHWDGTAWTATPSGTTAGITALWGAAANDVWAAIAEAGALLHWDGTVWTRVDTGFTALIADLTGTAPNDAWAVATGAIVLHWDGTEWVAVAGGATQNLTTIRANGSTVAAAGDGGVILRRTASTWERIAPTGPMPATFNDLWATGAAPALDAFAVGSGGAIARRLSDGSWVPQASPLTIDLLGVAGTAVNDVWAVGSTALAHWNGATWTTESAPSGANLVDVCASGPGEYWAAGATLLGWDGSDWVPAAYQPGTLERVFCTGPGEAWASGRPVWYEDAWRLTQCTGGVWGPTGPGVLFGWIITDAWGPAVDELWVVAHQSGASKLLHWNGGIWRPVDPGSGVELLGVGGSAPDDVWFVGAGGAALRWNGTAFEDHDVTTTERLLRVFGVSATDAIAAGDHGGLYRWNGTSWGVLAASGSTTFGDVWVAGPAAAWATTSSRLYRWDGTAWAEETSASIYDARVLFGFSATDVWAVEEYGDFYHWDGTTWTENSPSSIGIYQILDLWGPASDDLWAINEDGGLQHWNGTAWADAGTLDTHLDSGFGGVLFGAGDEVWHVTQDFFDDTTIAFHYDGRAWAPYTTLSGPVAMGGPAPDDVTAIDRLGGVWHWDGRGWSVVRAAEEDARDVRGGWVFGADDAWVLSLTAGPGHWTGTAWTDVGTGGLLFFNAFGGAPDGTLWGLGTNGAILRRGP